MNIPKILWHIWIGPNPAPVKWMQTWRDKHPEWDYILFDNTALSNKKFYNQHLIDEYMARGKYNGVADLIRYELLYEHGGFMPEADAICLENTNELWNKDTDTCYTVYENETIRPSYVSPIYACNPGNKFLKNIIDELHGKTKLKSKVYQSTGNLFLAEMIEKYKPSIKIFPSHYFIPSHYTTPNTRYTGPDKIYAEQFWGSTYSGVDIYSNGT